MPYHHSNDDGGGKIGTVEYSGDERDSRSGGEEQLHPDIHDLQDKPIYLLEHLATFTVNKDSGIVFPADGMRRLLQLEKTTGIWSQKMQLCLDCKWVLIMDYETENIIERFPATLIQEPTAFTSTDAMELYNNILVFIVSGGTARSEMHIFQSQSVSALHLVEDLKNLRNGKLPTQKGGAFITQKEQQEQLHELIISKSIGRKISEPQHHHQTSQTQLQQDFLSEKYGTVGRSLPLADSKNGETDSERGINGGTLNDETSSTSSDKYERDVTVLNHCFDDIEKFIARLQHAAAALRELERRRCNRKTKKKDPGEGLLTLRTRPPHEKEFIDIFAKFKLSFNLLAKLKAHIHDPNAPELVHFLFTPLALIVEASTDTHYEAQLPARVVTPLLTRDAINLLINCVTSKETELWRSLGDAWIVPRDQWKDEIGSYHPVFLDGWSPDYLVIDELDASITAEGIRVSGVVMPTTPTSVTKKRLEYAYRQNTHHMHQQYINPLHGLSAATSRASNYDDYGAGDFKALDEKINTHHADRGISAGHHHHLHDLPSATKEHSTASGHLNGADLMPLNDISIGSMERSGGIVIGSTSLSRNPSNAALMHSLTAGMQNLHVRDAKSDVFGCDGYTPVTDGNDHIVESWIEELQAAGAKIVLITYPRTANNDKELSVVRGEYLEILDDTRKWWKARNIRGQIAHVPHTIVTPYNYTSGLCENDRAAPPTGDKQYHQSQNNIYKQNKYAEINENAVNLCNHNNFLDIVEHSNR